MLVERVNLIFVRVLKLNTFLSWGYFYSLNRDLQSQGKVAHSFFTKQFLAYQFKCVLEYTNVIIARRHGPVIWMALHNEHNHEPLMWRVLMYPHTNPRALDLCGSTMSTLLGDRCGPQKLMTSWHVRTVHNTGLSILDSFSRYLVAQKFPASSATC